MIRRSAIALAIAGLIGLASGNAEAAALDFSSNIGSQIVFTGAVGGTTINFGMATATAPCLVPGSPVCTGVGDVGGYAVNIIEPGAGFVIGANLGANRYAVNGTGSLSITGGGNSLTGTLSIVDIYQAGTGGGTNFSGTANLSGVSVVGTNPTLLQFVPTGVLTTTFQFTAIGNLASIVGLGVGQSQNTSFSGTITPVPEPGSLLLLGGGLLGLAKSARRRMKRSAV